MAPPGQSFFRGQRSSAGLRSFWVVFAIILFCCSSFGAVVYYYHPINGFNLSHASDAGKPFSPAEITTTSAASQSSNLSILRFPCGSTPAEARAAGCLFDPNSFVWNHPRCHNANLTAEFLAIKKWSWFTDDSRSRELSLEEVMTGEHNNAIVSMGFHVQHCLAMWRLLHAQSLGPYGRFGVDSYVGNMMHTRHCGTMMTQTEVGQDEYNTQIIMKYPHCGMNVLSEEEVMEQMKMDHGHNGSHPG